MSNIEIRTGKAAPVEFRAAAEGSDSPGTLAGYAIVFNSLSRDLGGFVERVVPEAVTKTLADEVRVMGRYNHDNNYLLGTTEAETLRIWADETGLPYEIDLPNTSAGRDVAVLAARGDLRYSSFAFMVPPGGDEWGWTEQDYPLRTIKALQLVDVAPVNDPAYLDTTVGMRSLERYTAQEAERIGLDPSALALMPLADARKILTSSAAAEAEAEQQGQRETHPYRDALRSLIASF